MKWFLFVSILFLQACSNLPANIKNPPSVNVQLDQVLTDSNSYQNYPVRWGGTVIDVENEADQTNIQILFYPLDYYGRPKVKRSSPGRFVTVSKQFLDPAIFSKGTEITVTGTLQGTLEKKIGGKSIPLPVVVLDNHHIWPQYRQNYYGGYGYSPYYSRYRNFPYYSFRGRRGYYGSYNYCY